MKKLNNKGFTLVELLAVIVVLAIVMGLAVVAITGVLDNARKATFAADAKSFLEGAHQLVRSDEVNSMLGTTGDRYAPTCSNASGGTIYIPVAAIDLDQGGEKSPYGNSYIKSTGTDAKKPQSDYKNIKNNNVQASYIKVTSTVNNGACKYTYEIYLTDGVYSVMGASAGSSVPETEVDTSKVKPGA